MAHYTPVPETDKQITRNEIYLIDAGTQYKGEYFFFHPQFHSLSSLNATIPD